MIVILIFSIVLVLCGIWLNSNDFKGFDMVCLVFGTSLFILSLINIHDKDNPTALDVYRGKTTLEVTYRDSIPIDSIVVFKDKEI